MHFDKDGKIQWLQIYNEDNVVELKIVFNKVEYNTNFEKDYFKVGERYGRVLYLKDYAPISRIPWYRSLRISTRT